jgi:AcrR family transcriptional regulator
MSETASRSTQDATGRKRRPRRKTAVNTLVQTGRKSTQRERLLRGMVEVANRSGYAGATVSAVIADAGVSRPTFYDYFEDRDACFLATLLDVQRGLTEAARRAIDAREPQAATAALVEALVGFASEQPARARYLMSEALAGGEGARDARDQGIVELADLVVARRDELGPESVTPDLEPRVLIGTVYRLLAVRLRRGDPAISKLAEDLQSWIGFYDVALDAQRWSAPAPTPARAQKVARISAPEMPPALPRGRPSMSEEEIAQNHRLRILYAVARMAEMKGYTATTVVDIMKLARVDGHVFYGLFSSKQEAFMAAHELGFQQVMDVTSTAFFTATDWPQRSWAAGRALVELLEDNPLVAHVGFVEAYAVGPGAVQRIDDARYAFMFFLQEGLVYRPGPEPPSRLALESIVTSVLEIGYLQARGTAELGGTTMLAHIAHLWLTPFLGPADANDFIDSQLSRTSS